MKAGRSFTVWFGLLVLILLVASWQALSGHGLISSLFFPPPSTILTTLYNLAVSGILWEHLGITMLRMLLGLLLGGIPGLILGLLMGWSRPIKIAVDPFVAALHPLPKIAILPLIMIIFGIGELSKVVAVAVAVFFPMLINSLAGVLQINPVHFEVARLHRASPLQTFVRVILPGSLPMIVAGLRISLNSALLITIAVELVAARTGLGALIWLSWEILRTENLYAGLIVIGLIGILSNVLMQRLSTRLLPWMHERG